MANETNCSVCHGSGQLYDFVSEHLTNTTYPMTPTLTLAITGVTNTAQGATPTVTFTVQENGAPVTSISSLASLSVTVAGPTTDYATSWQYVIQGNGATGTVAPVAGMAGTYAYTFPAPMPATATGTYAFALEGSVLGPVDPFTNATTVGYALNPVFFAGVTDQVPVPRRKVVDVAQCNGCHFELQAHGGARMEAQYCSFCHNPNKANDQRVARFEVPETTAQSVDFKVLIHKIHMGSKLIQQPYVIGGYPAPTFMNPGGTPMDFGLTAFPGDISSCPTCHKGATYLLPLGAAVQPSLSEVLACTDANPVSTAYCQNRVVSQQIFTPPTTSVCTACHDAPSVVAHAQLNTTASGVEACLTCHGPGADWDVQLVHAPAP
jgi:OmcA/MtrC family decaheme c-type cytochrome